MVSDAGFCRYTSLPARDSCGCDQRVLMVRRADHDGVDILVGQKLVVVVVAGDPVVGLARLLGIEVVDETAFPSSTRCPG